jgi:EAL domain-containing protein (putative c-di-GMP-specific phosphodiesterase class I)
MGEGVIRVFESKLERNQQLQYNKLLDEAKRLENKVEINNALSAYEQVLRYGVENNLLDDNAIRNMENNERDVQLVALILGIAKNLKIPVIAEGVETETQLQILKNLGCTLVQGYYLSRPLHPAEFETELLTNSEIKA